MDFRRYLRDYRDPRQLSQILALIGKGILELHSLGYVHRDLKPDNIVLNLRPLEVRIIDFDRVQLRSQSTKGTVMGTPGYFPIQNYLKDGSTKWDAWSYAAIILESDLRKDGYLLVNREQQAVKIARAHTEEKETCPQLRELLNYTVML